MLIKALEHANADQHNQLNSWINAETFQPAEKIAAVTELYDRIGVKAVCENKILEYSNRAMESLAAVSIAEEKRRTEKDNRKFDTQRSLTVLFCNYAL